jgi:hypothetical protein
MFGGDRIIFVAGFLILLHPRLRKAAILDRLTVECQWLAVSLR